MQFRKVVLLICLSVHILDIITKLSLRTSDFVTNKRQVNVNRRRNAAQTNSERQKRFRKRHGDAYREREAARMRHKRQELGKQVKVDIQMS